jgi:hypothetical protein
LALRPLYGASPVIINSAGEWKAALLARGISENRLIHPWWTQHTVLAWISPTTKPG